MAELDRFMREISFESKEYNIYEPDISSSSNIQKDLSLENRKSEKNIGPSLQILLNKNVMAKYVMDFNQGKLRRVKSVNKLDKGNWK